MNELLALSQKDPLPIFQLLKQIDPISVREQVCSTDPHFFFDTLSNYHDGNGAITRFCLDNGYNPKQQYHKKLDKWSTSGVVSQEKIGEENYTDYLYAWRGHNDNVLYELTLHVGQDYIRELDLLGVPLLLKAYEKGFTKTVELLTQWGLNPEESKSMAREGYNLQEAIGNQTAMQQLYFQLKNKSNSAKRDSMEPVDEFQFKHIYDWIHTHLEKIHSKDDWHIKKIEENMEINLPTLSREQQERIVAETLTYNNINFYKKALAIMGEKTKTYQAQFVQPWSYLPESPSHHFIKHFLEQNVALDAYDSFKKVSYIESLADKLTAWGYRDNRTYNSFDKKVDEKMKGSVQRLLLKHKDSDFWLMNNPHDDNQPWFLTACKDKAILNVFVETSWLFNDVKRLKTYMDEETKTIITHREKELFSDNKINYHQSIFLKNAQFTVNFHSPLALTVTNIPGSVKEPVEFADDLAIEMDYLRRTWLFKDNQNCYAIEHALKNTDHLFSENSFMDSKFSELLTIDMDTPIFNLEEKTFLFKGILRNVFERTFYSPNLINSKTFTTLFNNVKASPDFDWSFVDEQQLKKHKENAPELVSELSYLKLNQSIAHTIGEIEDEAPVKMKI